MMFSGMAACSRSRVTGLLQRAELPRVSRRVSRVIVRAASAQAQERKAGVSTIQESKGQIDKNPPRGTRDFPPEEMRARNWLFGEWEKVSRVFGFEEYDVPVLETEELFTRKAGEEIVGQLYNFEKGKSLPLPAKWFAIAQCWRYERTTRGRRREHYQWNMDIVGVPGVEAEAEILAAITTFFQRVGLSSKDIKIKVSNRKVLSAVLQQYGVTEKMFGPVCVIVDKMDKLPREKVEEELSEIGVDATAVEGILSALQIRAIGELGKVVGEDSSAVLELQRLFQLADGYGFADWLEFDASVVRGLAYYTGTVFEAFDRQGTFRAICGGGRYDRLVSTLGGAETPMVGFGFGDAVIMELLRDRKLMPDLPQQVDDVVMPLDEEARPFANSVAARLRAAGRTVDVVLESKKMKWAFKHAERISAERLMVLGSSEVENRSVRVKYLQSREEEDVPLDELCSKQQP